MAEYDLHKKAAAIVRDAGGELVGRTRLQKVAYLSQLAGFAEDFPFEYRHYGPYSEELAEAMKIASGLQFVKEKEKQADWGGWYSIYSVEPPEPEGVPVDDNRANFISAAAGISAIELELAATAAFLFAKEGVGRDNEGNPWEETAERKPEKAGGGRLKRAKEAYRQLQDIDTPTPLPQIADL